MVGRKARQATNLSFVGIHVNRMKVGLAVSLLHRFGIDEKHDHALSNTSVRPGAPLDVDTWRRQLRI